MVKNIQKVAEGYEFLKMRIGIHTVKIKNYFH